MAETRSLNRRSGRTGRRSSAAGLAIGGIVLAGGFLLAGCSGSAASHSSASSGTAAKAAAPGQAGAPAAPQASNGSAARQPGSTGTAARLAPASSIIYTAQLSVRAPDVGAAAAEAAQTAEGAGGYVSNETASAQPDDPSQATATVQLKIPVGAYPATLARLARGLGTQLSLQQQAQDVTEQVADVNSQVTSDEAAIAQLRTLLSHAGSVGDLLTVQNQINAEESDLETMEAQQRALSDETAYATVTVTIVGPRGKPVVYRPKPPPSLASGLGAGWRALRVTLAWTLAILGAVAPFAAIAAIAAYAIHRGRRRLLRRRPATPES
jgi:Domain of unknown function (DUF4349)